MKTLHGLYAITDNYLIGATEFVETVEQAILGGAQVIQYRDKSDNQTQRFEQAQALCQLCQRYQVPFIVNDDIELARQIHADGVHLGKEDIDLVTARAILGESAIIGVSCYNQFALAQRAVTFGASYVAFGRFFPSQIKPNAVGAHPDLLRQARHAFTCPLVAIGGITPDNGAELIAAGADCLAVIQGVFGQPDVKAAAQRYAQLFR